MQDLSKLRDLSTINIRVIRGWGYPPHAQLTEWLGWSKKILFQVVQNSEDKMPNKVAVYLNGEPEISQKSLHKILLTPESKRILLSTRLLVTSDKFSVF